METPAHSRVRALSALHCHSLLQERAVSHLPVWVVALVPSGTWLADALAPLVSAAAEIYSCCQCPQVGQLLPLLVSGVCDAVAGLAAALQHVATNADAPGMRSGRGALLRSKCGRLCMQLRDVFMPSASLLPRPGACVSLP